VNSRRKPVPRPGASAMPTGEIGGRTQMQQFSSAREKIAVSPGTLTSPNSQEGK